MPVGRGFCAAWLGDSCDLRGPQRRRADDPVQCGASHERPGKRPGTSGDRKRSSHSGIEGPEESMTKGNQIRYTNCTV